MNGRGAEDFRGKERASCARTYLISGAFALLRPWVDARCESGDDRGVDRGKHDADENLALARGGAHGILLKRDHLVRRTALTTKHQSLHDDGVGECGGG